MKENTFEEVLDKLNRGESLLYYKSSPKFPVGDSVGKLNEDMVNLYIGSFSNINSSSL